MKRFLYKLTIAIAKNIEEVGVSLLVTLVITSGIGLAIGVIYGVFWLFTHAPAWTLFVLFFLGCWSLTFLAMRKVK